tara:strand:- start:230 stop:838 length:609 start_codon:yes stop_codon:yes gene_type:complete
MAYLGSQPNNVRKNIGLYTPSEILQLTKDGNWGGSLEFIKQVDVSSSSTCVITDIKEDIYDVHYFTFTLTGSHQDHTLFINFSEDGGSSYVTSNYSYSKNYGQTNGTFNQATNASTSYIQLAQSVDSNLGCYNYGYFYFLGNSGRRSQYSGFSVFERSGDSGVKRFEFGGGNQFDDKSIDAIKIYPNVGTMTGTFKLYGVKE